MTFNLRNKMRGIGACVCVFQEKFQNEMEQYAQLRSGVNVARLVGVCTEMEPLYAIFEYTEWVSTLSTLGDQYMHGI